MYSLNPLAFKMYKKNSLRKEIPEEERKSEDDVGHRKVHNLKSFLCSLVHETIACLGLKKSFKFYHFHLLNYFVFWLLFSLW